MSRKFGESKVPTTPQNGFNVRGNNRDSTIKHMFYNWDQEMEIIRATQKCQRNWDYSRDVHPEIIDYLLWHAEEAPSKLRCLLDSHVAPADTSTRHSQVSVFTCLSR